MDVQRHETGYRPQTHSLKLSKADAKVWGVCNGWAFSGYVLIKATPTGCKPEKEYTRWPDQVEAMLTSMAPMLPAVPVSTVCFDPSHTSIPGYYVLCQSGDHKEVYRAEHLDIVHTAFPAHRAAMTETGEYIAINGGQVVALVCPYRNVTVDDFVRVSRAGV